MSRPLAAIWHLNNAEGPGGETGFPIREIKVKPGESRLVLFPPFRTHPQRAVLVQRGVKSEPCSP